MGHTDSGTVADGLTDRLVCRTDGETVMDGLMDWLVCRADRVT